MLADLGADVVVVARPNKATLGNPDPAATSDPLRRGKRIVPLDLKWSGAVEEAMLLIETADALIEGNRAERDGTARPRPCRLRKAQPAPRLRPHDRLGSGWTARAGGGAQPRLSCYDGRAVADGAPRRRSDRAADHFGDAGGALGLTFGIMSGVFAAGRTGTGCVVDAAIIDIVGALSGIALWARSAGMLDGPRPSIFHKSPFYDAYLCADGRYVTIGALEPQFYTQLIEKLGLADVDPKAQYDMRQWPALKARFAELFLSRPTADWRALLEGSDVCFAPVLSFAEAALHPHNAARGIYRQGADGRLDAAEAPRFTPLA